MKHRAVDVLANYELILKFDWICLCVDGCYMLNSNEPCLPGRSYKRDY